MSWLKKVDRVIALGRTHHGDTTAEFIKNLRAGLGDTPATLETLVAALPSTCKQMAREAIAEARKAGTDCREISDAAISASAQLDAEEYAARQREAECAEGYR